MDYTDPIPSFVDWMNRQQKCQAVTGIERRRTVRSRAGQSQGGKHTHNPLEETYPDHQWYNLTITPTESKENIIIDKLLSALPSTGATDEELSTFYKFLSGCKSGPAALRLVVTLIGEQGIGKSTLVNALLGRLDLAKASGSSRSCTQHATTYEYLPGASDDAKTSDVRIKLMDIHERESNIKEHVKNFGNFHFSAKGDSILLDEQAEIDHENEPIYHELDNRILTEMDRRLASNALEFFEVIWRSKNDLIANMELSSLLNAENVCNGNLLRRCLEKQEERIRQLPVNEEGIVLYKNVTDALDPILGPDDLDIKKVRDIAADIWPLVDMVIIATGSRLLRNGIVLVDLPGFGDLNQNRTAVANRIRRDADYEIIVSQALRIETSEETNRLIYRSEKAHGLDHTVLVVNRSDLYEANDTEVNEIVDQGSQPFCQLVNERLDELERLGAESDPLLVNRYRDFIWDYAGSAVKQFKAEAVAQEMKKRFSEELHVFALTASEYVEWLKPNRTRDPKFLPMVSGVPRLVKFLLGLTAETNLENYERHYFQTLPSIFHKIKRIVHKGKDDDLYAQFLNALSQDVRSFRDNTHTSVRTVVATSVPQILQHSDIIAANKRVRVLINNWADLNKTKWGTFDYILRSVGIPLNSQAVGYKGKDINWNRELLETIEPLIFSNNPSISSRRFVQEWKVKMDADSDRIATRIIATIHQTLTVVATTIYWPSNSPHLMDRVIEEWRNFEVSTNNLLTAFADSVRAAILAAYRKVTTEEDIRCTIAKLNKNAFSEAALQGGRGPGFHKRQVKSLRANLEQEILGSSTFIERYQDAAVGVMKSELARVSDQLLNSVNVSLNEFVETAKQFVATDTFETTDHLEARRILLSWLPEFQDALFEIQSTFPGHVSKQDFEIVKSAKMEGGSPFCIKVEEE